MLYPELIEGLLEYDIDSHVLVVLPKNKNTIGLVAVNPNVTVVLIPNVINMIAKIFPILRVLYIFKFIDGYRLNYQVYSIIIYFDNNKF